MYLWALVLLEHCVFYCAADFTFNISLLKTQFYAFFCKDLNSQVSHGEIKKFILVWRKNISFCVEGLEALRVQL